MKTINAFHLLSVALLAIALGLFSTKAKSVDLLDMSEQLDKADSQDFQLSIDKANQCTRIRDFSCTEAELKKAAKLVNNPKDKEILVASRKALSNEREAVDNEIVRRQEREDRIRKAEREAEEAAERQSTREYNAEIGRQITEGARANAALLNNTDRQINAAYAEVERKRAAQAAAREREAERRREAARESAALADAKRVAIAEPKRKAIEPIKYQPQVVTLPKADLVCPPGSTWYNPETGIGAKGGTCYQNPQAKGQTYQQNTNGSNSSTVAVNTGNDYGSTSSNDKSSSSLTPKQEKKMEWGPVKLEALAICRQSSKSGKWQCYGALDNQIIVDEPSLESALARQHCAGGTWAAGGPEIKGMQWDTYRCGHSLGHGDYDVAKRYGLITARNSYICPKYELGDGRCTTIYDGQDKR